MCRWGQLGDSGRAGTAGFGGWEAALGTRSTLLLPRGDVLLLRVSGVLLLGCSLRFGWRPWGDKAPSGAGAPRPSSGEREESETDSRELAVTRGLLLTSPGLPGPVILL